MQLWPTVLLWPKPKAASQRRELNNNNRNIPHATKCRKLCIFLSHTNTNGFFKWLWVFAINAWLLITTTVQGSTIATTLPLAAPPLASPANYAVGATNPNADVVAALTELSNGYAAAAATNYMKNYYQVRESEDNENIQKPTQQQQQQLATTNNAGLRTELQGGNVNSNTVAAASFIGRGFMDLPSNNYGNSIVAQRAGTTGIGLGVGGGGRGGGASFYQGAFNLHESGFVPTTFTPAGQHYAASLASLQPVNNKMNTEQHYVTSTSTATTSQHNSETNKNDLQQNRQQYGNDQSNSNTNVANDNNKSQQQHSLYRRLANYAGHFNGGGDGDSRHNTIPNYTLAYADDGKQSAAILQNYYNEQQPYNALSFENGGDIEQQQQHGQQHGFVNYIAPTMITGYEVEENPTKYYTFNNNYQTNEYEQQQQQQQQQQQHYEQPFKLKTLTTNSPNGGMAPATYYQTFIQHKNDNDREQQQQQQRQQQQQQQQQNNYQHWPQQNQITGNYQQKQSRTNNRQQEQQYSIEEPEAAETTHSTRRIKKSSSSPISSSKSKRSDTSQNQYAAAHDNDIETETGTDFDNSLQLEQLQQQLQQQQQQFIALQHQLIEHDQQLQIQKQLSPPPTLPPVTHTVHHNAQSLQAISGIPLAKHTQVVKTIPIQQHHQVHVPYRQNVAVEVPDPVITTVNRPMPIEIPVTRTVAVPNIQEVKIPIEKVRPFPVERPIPYIVEKRVPYAVEKQIAKPVYYPVPIKVPIVHTVVHKVHQPQYNHGHGGGYYNQPHAQAQSHQSFHLPHTVYRTTSHDHGLGHTHSHGYGYGHGHGYGGHHGHHTHHYVK